MIKNFIVIPNIAKAIILLLMAYVCFGLLNIISKVLYMAHMDPFIITFYRSLFSLILVAPFAIIMMVKMNRFKLDKTNLLKGVIDFLSFPAWIMAVSHMNIPEAVGLSYVTPLLTAILAIIFLKDHFSLDKWVIMLIGITGAYIILKPDAANFNHYSWYALIACVLWACGNILTKNLTNSQPPVLIVFFTNLVIFVLTLPFIIVEPVFPESRELIICLIMSVLAAGSSLLIAYACKFTQLSNLVPHDYCRLILATIFAYIFLNQTIEVNTVVGTSLIFVSSLYLTRKQLKNNVKV